MNNIKELKKKFIKELLKAQNEETVEINDWNRYFDLEIQTS